MPDPAWSGIPVTEAGWEELPLDLLLDGSLGIPQAVIFGGVVIPIVTALPPFWTEVPTTDAGWTEILVTETIWTEVPL